MRNYFKPLRRKIGVVTLVMACVLTMSWIRCFLIADIIIITLPTFGPQPFIVSSSGRIGIWAMDGWDFDGSDVSRPWDLYPLHIFCITWLSASRIQFHFDVPAIPHWYVFTPLFFLSAWLLLSNPRAGEIDGKVL